MKLSPVTKSQWLKVAKTAAYLGVSAAIGGVIAAITDDPSLFGVATPIVNIVLVTIKQALSEQ